MGQLLRYNGSCIARFQGCILEYYPCWDNKGIDTIYAGLWSSLFTNSVIGGTDWLSSNCKVGALTW